MSNQPNTTITPAAAQPPAAAPAPVPAPAPFQSASLYVGDLNPEVTESLLFELFNTVGPVASIRVCRDSVTRRSLGYAYVNFHNVQDAERALDTMNFTDINKRPCRIMWSQRDPSLRKSGLGNIYIRNLAPTVDNKGLYDTFSVFGNILSCKVVTDEDGNSKGYGYVHFETAEAAQDALKFDGTSIDDMPVNVGIFVRRQDRAGQNDWTNLYIKQFPLSWDEDKLKALFEPYGTISSLAITKDEEGKSKGFGFIDFAEHDSAAKVLEELANKTLEDGEGGNFELYVSRAQKKTERLREIKSKLDALVNERVSKYQGMNLYVKNISDSITDDQFRETFAPFGTITSARIMRENTDNGENVSKGFGFVCYSSPEEATRAVTELNGKTVGGKPLVVTLHQRKEHRRAQLAANFAPNNMRFNQGMGPGGMPMPPFMGMYMGQGGQPGFPGVPGGPRGMPYPYPGGGPGMAGRGGGRGNMGGMYGAPRPGFPYPGVPGMMPQMGQPGGQPAGGRGGRGPGGQGGFPVQGGRGNMGPGRGNMMNGRGAPMGGPRGMPGAYPNQMGGMPGQPPMRGQQPNIKFNNQVRNQNGQMMPPQVMPQQQPQHQMMPPPSGGIDLLDAQLAQADPQTQKNIIGENLYPLIYRHQPEQAGKITGMLLEMDNGELLNLIESPDALISKIEEALAVLRMHRAAEE